MPDRNWRISTTFPSGVTGMMLTQSGDSITTRVCSEPSRGSATRSSRTLSTLKSRAGPVRRRFHGGGRGLPGTFILRPKRLAERAQLGAKSDLRRNQARQNPLLVVERPMCLQLGEVEGVHHVLRA